MFELADLGMNSCPRGKAEDGEENMIFALSTMELFTNKDDIKG